MDNAAAFKAIDRAIQQYDAMIQLREVLTVAKSAERYLKESDDVIKRKNAEVAALDAAIAKRKADEASVRERADALIRNAIAQGNATRAEAKKDADEERERKNADVAKANARLEDIRQQTAKALNELDNTKHKVAAEQSTLNKVIAERKSVTDAIMKLASGAK